VDFSIKGAGAERARSGCIVAGVFEPRKLTAPAAALDRRARGALDRVLAAGDMDGCMGTTLLVRNLARVASPRVLLTGLGRARGFDERRWREAVRTAVRALLDTGAQEAVLTLTELPLPGRDSAWKVRQAVLIAEECAYRFDEMKSKRDARRPPLRRLALTVPAPDLDAAQIAANDAGAIAQGMALARDLGNLPGNLCTPTYLADRARALAKEHKLGVEILDKRDIEKLGMGALLAVARGSHQPPRLIVLQYRGAGRGVKPYALVGKGITFDTGGISIKPAAEMDEMKFAMCGAAGVLGTVKAVATLGLPINLVAIVPSTENMPGGGATKPGDIVTTMSGRTVEVLNTDAEGRLILCDALTYAERFEPQAVVDVATLTGACVIALGHVASGLFTPDDALAGELVEAGDAVHDRAWRMPVWEDYQEQLKSNFADFANIGGRPAGAVTAACFLARFAKKFRWAHLDIAGTAWRSGAQKGATGRPVALLTQYLIGRARM
jgi:leucyl aminopeptidase